MEKNNLNDIVIEDANSTKKTQLKNILTLLALLFIILVISIVITKLILGEDTENPVNPEMIATETTEEITETDANNSGIALSSSTLGTATTTTAAAGAALASAAMTASDTTNNTVDTFKAPLLAERNTTSNSKQPLRDYQGGKKDTTTASSSSSPKSSTYSRPKYIATGDRTSSSSSSTKETPTKYSSSRGYYIKVGTFEDPSTAIDKIKAIGLTHKTTKNPDGLTRVLIGPFYSKKDAADHLSQAQDKVAKDAYITKIK